MKEFEDSQVESLKEVKKHMIEKLNSGGGFQGPKVIETIKNQQEFNDFRFYVL